MVRREAFARWHYHPSTLSSSSSSSSSLSSSTPSSLSSPDHTHQRQQQKKHHHHQYHLYYHHINIFTPLSFLSSKSLQNHFHHHRRRRHRYYNCLEQKHVEKEVEYMPYSVGYHRYFISQSTKALQLKKRARFWYAKNYFIVKTIYWWQWLRHSICISINKLHLQLVELSKIANKDSQ